MSSKNNSRSKSKAVNPTVVASLQRASAHQRRLESQLLIRGLGLEGKTKKDALQALGKHIEELRAAGKSTRYLDSIVGAILEIDDPGTEDQELGAAWESIRRGYEN